MRPPSGKGSSQRQRRWLLAIAVGLVFATAAREAAARASASLACASITSDRPAAGPPAHDVAIRAPVSLEGHARLLLGVLVLVALGGTAYLLGVLQGKAASQRARPVRPSEPTRDTIVQLFLATCASCKRVRDVRGEWHDLIQYVAKHFNVTFSHGICPDCIRKLYPDVADEILALQQTASTDPVATPTPAASDWNRPQDPATMGPATSAPQGHGGPSGG